MATKKRTSTHRSETLEWFDQCLANMENNLVGEKRTLDQHLKRVVECQQDIVCLTNLLRCARAKGETRMERNWRERNFKGRR